LEELATIVKSIFGEYNGTAIIAIVAAVTPYVRGLIRQRDREIETKRELIRAIKRSNQIDIALTDYLITQGIKINVPKIAETD